MAAPVAPVASTQQVLLQHRLFRHPDSDGDKALSLSDLKDSRILGKIGAARTGGDVDAAFEKMDADGNGSLNENETRDFFVDRMKASPAVQAMVTLMVSQEKATTPTWSSWLSDVYANRSRLQGLQAYDRTARRTHGEGRVV